MTEKINFSGVQYLTVDKNNIGQRVDNFLINRLNNLPKSKIYKILRKGEVRVNKKRIKAEYKLQLNDEIRIPPLYLEEKKEIFIPDYFLDLIQKRVIFTDENFLIFNKPAGIAVHAGSQREYGLIDVVKKIWGENYAHLAHRIDRDTTGVLVLAKNRPALNAFQQASKDGRITKKYIFLTNDWRENCREIQIYLKKTEINGEEKMLICKKDEPNSKLAITQFAIRQKFLGAKLVEAKLLSGRTHQIRVSVKSQGFGIAGDKKYGDFQFNRKIENLGYKSMFLHAEFIEFEYQNRKISVRAELGEEEKKLLAKIANKN
ncbi:MAG: RluA family pseudouridine synthase [Cardiobacteriaceae bacterium]|nr:RluA family pseudouridine synthase [Cardiobacteriaceae bacterium]